MFGIPTFDLLTDKGKQEFIEYIVNLTRKEIISYSPSYVDSSSGVSDLIGNIVYQNTKYLDFDTVNPGSSDVGQIAWNDTEGTLEFGLKGGNLTLQIGQEQAHLVKHADNTGLTKGKAVYIVGSDGSNHTVRYALADSDPTSSKTFGIMGESVSGGAKAFCTTQGMLSGVDTSALTEGAAIWLSPTVSGGLTSTKPTAPNHLVLLGWCIRSSASNGSIFVHIVNGFELDELHDVQVTSVQPNDLLQYDSTIPSWKNVATIGASKVTGTAVTQADTGTVTSTMILDGTIVNADINASAAIDKTKISGTAITAADTGTVTSTMILNDTIVNADINSAAAIAYSKLNLNNSIVQADLVAALQALLVPTGTITPFAGGTLPSGWVWCDGATYDGNNATYTALWNTIGVTYGGTGQSAFIVPDLRGNIPIGVKTTQTSNPDVSARGKTGGAYTFTLTTNQIPAHQHPFTPAGTMSGSTASFDASHGHTDTLAAPAHTHTITHTHDSSAAGFRYVTNAAGGGSLSLLQYSGGTSTTRDTGYNTGGSSAANTGAASATALTGTIANATTNTSAASLNHSHGIGTIAFTGTAGNTNNNTTTGSAVNNFSPYVAVNYIIKL